MKVLSVVGARPQFVKLAPIAAALMAHPRLVSRARSGGINLTAGSLRTETEWTETLEDGWNVLDLDLVLVGTAVDREPPTKEPASPCGQGTTAPTAVRVLAERVRER